jgi:hypothetical protein
VNELRGVCVHCGEEVRGHAARELSTAWEVERGAGGANQVSGPKAYSGRVAHPVCHESAVRMTRSGLNAGQESLL